MSMRPRVLDLLLRYGADANARDTEGNSVVHTAAEAGSVAILEILSKVRSGRVGRRGDQGRFLDAKPTHFHEPPSAPFAVRSAGRAQHPRPDTAASRGGGGSPWRCRVPALAVGRRQHPGGVPLRVREFGWSTMAT